MGAETAATFEARLVVGVLGILGPGEKTERRSGRGNEQPN